MSRRAIGWLLLSVVGCAGPGVSHAGNTTAPLQLESTITLAGVSGRIDHMAFDFRRKRLLVAELGNGTVDAIDVAAGKVLHRIAGLREPQGIAYAAKADVLAVASAGDGSVRLFRADDYTQLGRLDLGDDADNVRVDHQTGNLIVGYGAGALAVIDPVRRFVLSRVKLPAHPEGFQLDPTGRRVFVNLPDAQQIGAVDLVTGEQTGTWRVAGLEANFPMAYGESRAGLAVVFRSPARLVLLDTDTGGVNANLPTCEDADDVFFDSRRDRIYVSCGEGSVDVFQNDPTAPRLMGRIKTTSGARTSLFVPELDRLYVAARAGFYGLGSDAAILVFRPEP